MRRRIERRVKRFQTVKSDFVTGAQGQLVRLGTLAVLVGVPLTLHGSATLTRDARTGVARFSGTPHRVEAIARHGAAPMVSGSRNSAQIACQTQSNLLGDCSFESDSVGSTNCSPTDGPYSSWTSYDTNSTNTTQLSSSTVHSGHLSAEEYGGNGGYFCQGAHLALGQPYVLNAWVYPVQGTSWIEVCFGYLDHSSGCDEQDAVEITPTSVLLSSGSHDDVPQNIGLAGGWHHITMTGST